MTKWTDSATVHLLEVVVSVLPRVQASLCHHRLLTSICVGPLCLQKGGALSSLFKHSLLTLITLVRVSLLPNCKMAKLVKRQTRKAGKQLHHNSNKIWLLYSLIFYFAEENKDRMNYEYEVHKLKSTPKIILT